MTTTIQEVSALLPIVTPYTMPDDVTAAETLYNLASARLSTDGVSFSGEQETLAYCMIIAHVLSVKGGKSGVTSEHLGQWSVTYETITGSVYLQEYQAMCRKAHLHKFSTSIVRHNDCTCVEYLRIDDTTGGCS